MIKISKVSSIGITDSGDGYVGTVMSEINVEHDFKLWYSVEADERIYKVQQKCFINGNERKDLACVFSIGEQDVKKSEVPHFIEVKKEMLGIGNNEFVIELYCDESKASSASATVTLVRTK